MPGYIDLELEGEVHRLHAGVAYLIRIPADTAPAARERAITQMRAFLQGLRPQERPYVQLISEEAHIAQIPPDELERIARWYYGYEPLWPGRPAAQDAPPQWEPALETVSPHTWRLAVEAEVYDYAPSQARRCYTMVQFHTSSDQMSPFWLDLPDHQVVGRFGYRARVRVSVELLP